MADLRDDIRALYALADGGAGLAELLDGICEALERHPREVRDINASYRVHATDTGATRAFALENGAFRTLEEAENADVTVLGSEADLLRVFRRQLAPAAALLLGKIKVKGNKAALMRFAEFL